MCFSSPKLPTPPPQPRPEDAMSAGLRERQKRSGAMSFGSTILGGAMGGTATANTAPKSLLGG